MISGELCVILSYHIVHHVLTSQANVPLYPRYYCALQVFPMQTYIMQVYLSIRAILCIASV